MKTDSDFEDFAGSPSRGALRVHRASKDHVKTRRKILVVDDNKVILKAITTKLKACGYEVLTAEDGASAIRQVRQLEPHLILMDLNFPPDVGHGGGISWDGLLILSWLRRTIGVQKIPVIVMTGGDLEKYKDRCVEAGVVDIFLKPIDHDALLAAIRWALDEEVAEKVSTPVEPALEPVVQRETVRERVARVLFVDDSSDWRYLGAVYLGERGYEVATAEDPTNAMLLVSQFKPDLVVLDLNLGGQSAVVLLKVLAELRPELPILVYTGMDLDKAEISELLKQGAWNWLKKNSLEELGAAVERTISGPKITVSQSAAAPAEEQITNASVSHAETAMGPTAEESRQAASEPGSAAPALEDLRTVSSEELLSAVERASSASEEPTLDVPEAPVVVPQEVIESAAESILIVDDDTAVAETLRSFLESLLFRVSEVTTGAEAVSLIAAADIDLILFDLTLPDMRVEQFYDAVKQVKPHLCSRIIFMSGDDSLACDDGFVRRLKAISLWKPFPTDWLLEAVQTVRAATQNHCVVET